MKKFVIAIVILFCGVAMAAPNRFTSGTGVVVNRNYIVTASHLVHDRPYTCLYEASTGECHPVEVIADEPDADMAIVRIGNKRGNLHLGACAVMKDEVPVGTKVYTYRYPEPFSRKDFSQYHKISRVKDLDNYLGDERMYRINVQLPEGYSGGPSFDSQGRVIGISRSYSLVEDNVSNIIKSTEVLKPMKKVHIPNIGLSENSDNCAVIVVSSKEKFELY